MALAEEIMRREKQRMKDITDRVTSLVPNLEEDPRFPGNKKYHGQAAWLTAQQIVFGTDSKDDFLRVEMTYWDDGNVSGMFYVIGHGTLEYSHPRTKPAIFYLPKWYDNPTQRSANIKSIEMERISSFNPLEQA